MVKSNKGTVSDKCPKHAQNNLIRIVTIIIVLFPPDKNSAENLEWLI